MLPFSGKWKPLGLAKGGLGCWLCHRKMSFYYPTSYEQSRDVVYFLLLYDLFDGLLTSSLCEASSQYIRTFENVITKSIFYHFRIFLLMLLFSCFYQSYSIFLLHRDDIFLHCYNYCFEIGHSGLLFLCLFRFNTVDQKRKIANECIRTADLRCRKWPLYQLCHNQCSTAKNIVSRDKNNLCGPISMWLHRVDHMMPVCEVNSSFKIRPKVFFKCANHGLFCVFSFFSHSNSSDKYTMNFINWKKHRWYAWDSNPGRHDGTRRRIHWDMAAPKTVRLYDLNFIEMLILQTKSIA